MPLEDQITLRIEFFKLGMSLNNSHLEKHFFFLFFWVTLFSEQGFTPYSCMVLINVCGLAFFQPPLNLSFSPTGLPKSTTELNRVPAQAFAERTLGIPFYFKPSWATPDGLWQDKNVISLQMPPEHNLFISKAFFAVIKKYKKTSSKKTAAIGQVATLCVTKDENGH